jgi:hypothetical protein
MPDAGWFRNEDRQDTPMAIGCVLSPLMPSSLHAGVMRLPLVYKLNFILKANLASDTATIKIIK